MYSPDQPSPAPPLSRASLVIGLYAAMALVGLLVAVGTGDLETREIGRALTSRSDLPAKLTAPASGLFLEFVAYGGEAGVPQAAPFAID